MIYNQSEETHKIKQWRYKLKQRLKRPFFYDTPAFRAIMIGILVITSVLVGISSLGIPTSGGILFGVVTSISVNWIAMGFVRSILSYVFTTFVVPIPRLTLSMIISHYILLFNLAS